VIVMFKRVCCVSAVTLAAMASGCTEQPVHGLGHGASAEPTITVLLSDAAGAAADPTASTGAATATIAGYGTFKGRVVVSGAPPALPPLLGQGAPTKDAICAAKEIPDESVVIGSNGGLANVFIYLKKVPGGEIPAAPTDPVVIDQQGCRFLPHAAVCRVGQPMVFKNSDPVAHNTAFAPQSSSSFNQTIVANDQKGAGYTYSKPEAVPVRAKCDYHAWMGAYHLPLNHPWGVVTAEDGSFEIKGVPGTTVEFVVWHEKAQYLNRGLKVTIPVDGVIEQEIQVDASKLAAK
jgi:plastocyanin